MATRKNMNRSSKRSTRSAGINLSELNPFQDMTSSRDESRKSSIESFFYSTRPSGSGSRNDPFSLAPTPSTSLNPHPHKRKKPSTSVQVENELTTNTNETLSLRDSGTSYYSLPSAHHSLSELPHSLLAPDAVEYVVDSDAAGGSSRKGRDKGKAVDRAHTPYSGSSRRRRDASADESRRRKHQERTDKHMYSGPLAHAEFERMKKEIDTLKKAAHDHKKTAKKQTKVR
jgi:hypothetical protein